MYDFNKFEQIMSKLKDGVKPSLLADLKNELNRFFNDSTCKEVIYTENTDKMFFGMCVLPVIDNEYISDLVDGKFKRFTEYYLEIDSKLFDPLLKLKNRELTAITLHEVGHVVNNVKVSRDISDTMSYEIHKSGVSFDHAEAQKQGAFFKLAIANSVRKLTSLFEKNDEEYIADDFVVKCGYGADLEQAYDKIIKARDAINKSDKHRLMTMIWSLSVYKEMGSRRREILSNLDTASKYEPTHLYSNLYKNTYNFIKNFNMGFGQVNESAGIQYIRESDFFKKIKYNTLKTIEDDLYEFNIRAKNINDEQEAMDLLRSLNMRIGIIEEYIARETPEKSEADRLRKIADKFRFLRDEIVRTSSYHQKFYGLFVEYPDMNSSRSGRL